MGLFGAALMIGAGCQVSPILSNPSETRAVSLASLSPAQAAERLQFIGGDTFELKQTLFGMGTFLAELTKSKVGRREVQITHFAPMNSAELSWRLSVDERTARGLEVVSASGTVERIDLLRSHALEIPVYWAPGPIRAFDKSAVWLSDDAYAELSKTGKTVLNFGVMDPSINDLIKNTKEMQTALNKLRQQAATESAHKDLTLLQAEKDDVEYAIKVNGKEVKVAAIRAKNWFGEITVLKNRQNPLIVKLALNPQIYGDAQATSTETGLASVFGYQITNLNMQAVNE